MRGLTNSARLSGTGCRGEALGSSELLYYPRIWTIEDLVRLQQKETPIDDDKMEIMEMLNDDFEIAILDYELDQIIACETLRQLDRVKLNIIDRAFAEV